MEKYRKRTGRFGNIEVPITVTSPALVERRNYTALLTQLLAAQTDEQKRLVDGATESKSSRPKDVMGETKATQQTTLGTRKRNQNRRALGFRNSAGRFF